MEATFLRFIILLPSTTEASLPGLMQQFELYAIITPTCSTHAIAAYLACGRLCKGMISIEPPGIIRHSLKL